MIKAVIFDFMEVVVSSPPGRRDSLKQKIADLYGLKVDEMWDMAWKYIYEMSIGKLDEEEFWKSLSDGLGKPIPADRGEIWKIEDTQKAVLNSPIVELISHLKKRGIKAFVLSNTIPPHAKYNKSLGRFNYFDKVYLSCEIGFRKPDIEAYKLILNEHELSGAVCVYIDDMEENLVPARELGMKAILAVSPDQVVRDVMAVMN